METKSDVEFEPLHLHLQGLVAARAFALQKAASESRYSLGQEVSRRRASRTGGASPGGGACGLISPLASQGGGGPVAKGVVGVDTSPGVLGALTGAAEAAGRWPASRQLVHP
jgi:hypothetical protein